MSDSRFLQEGFAKQLANAIEECGEFLFWLVFFGMIGVAYVLHWLLTLVMRLKAAQREIARLRAEVSRCRTWLHHNADHWQVGDGRVRHP